MAHLHLRAHDGPGPVVRRGAAAINVNPKHYHKLSKLQITITSDKRLTTSTSPPTKWGFFKPRKAQGSTQHNFNV